MLQTASFLEVPRGEGPVPGWVGGRDPLRASKEACLEQERSASIWLRSQIFQLEPGQHELAPDYTHQHTNPEVDALFLEYLKTRNIQLKVYAHVLNPEYVPVSTARALLRPVAADAISKVFTTPPQKKSLGWNVDQQFFDQLTI